MAVKQLIRNGLQKNLKEILSDEVVLSFNLDGTHGKKRFKDHENIYDVIKSKY